MTLGVDAIGSEAIASFEVEGTADTVYPSAYTAALIAASVDWCILVDIVTYQRTTPDANQFGVAIPGVNAIGDLPGGILVTTEGQSVSRYSDVSWIGAPDDADEPNQPYWQRVDGLTYDRAMPLSPEADPRVSAQYGALVLKNGDRGLDSLTMDGVSGWPVTVRLGRRTDAYADFGIAVAAVGDEWERDPDELRLLLRGQEHRIEIPLQPNLFAGTGGEEGTADNEGQPKPLLYGEVKNVSPVLIDPQNLVYQVHDGPIHAVDAAYDGMAELTFDADYADFAALVAASLADGEYATCLALGLVRVEYDLADSYRLTLDVRGQASPTYAAQAGETMRRIALSAGLSVSDLHLAGIGALSWHNGAIGIYVTEAITAAEALDRIARGVGGWWGIRRDGKLTAGVFDSPSASYSLDMTTREILAIRALAMPEEIGPCNYRRRVLYQRNWTLLTKDEIAGDITENNGAIAQFAQTEWRTAPPSVDFSRQTQHRRATDPAALETILQSATDAEALADRLLAAYAPGRMLIAVQVPAIGLSTDLGETIRITFPGWGLGAGKRMRVIGIEEDLGDRTCWLTLWG